MKKAFYSIIGLAIAQLSVAQTSYWQQKVDYQMEVELNVETNIVNGKQKLVYQNNSPDTLHQVFYHLYFNAFQPGSMMDVRSRSIADPDPRVGSRISKLSPDEIGYQKIIALKQDGKKVNYQVEGTILEVQLAKPILPNSSSKFALEFESQVPVQIRRSGRVNKEGIRYSMTQWYPKMAEYDFQGWHANPYIGREFHGVWGDFDVKITIDSSYTLGATGYLKNKNEIGKGYQDKGVVVKQGAKAKSTWHFSAPQVHDFAWVADPDFTHTTADLENGTTLHFLYQADSNTVWWDSIPGYTQQIFESMNTHFGEYPYKQYTVAQGGDGGMEYPMMTLIRGHRSKGSLIGVTAHEAIHSWYQHLLATNESQYSWMDEGFTSYAEDVVLQEILPTFTPYKGSYRSYYALVKSGKAEALSTHADHYKTNRAYGTASYSMGLIFLHQLGYVIGEEVLMRGMKRYYYTWRYKHPTPNDFIRIMEKESGMELDWYLEQWIETTNTIDYEIAGVKPVNGKTEITLGRIGEMPMPIDLHIKYTDGTEEWINIPLRIMRGAKEAEQSQETYQVLTDWPWTHERYAFEINTNFDNIKSIEIDPTKRMADIDRSNNVYPSNEDKTFRAAE